jgi:transposase, IS6 family
MRREFKGRHFEGEVIPWAVRWCCRCGIGYREPAEMLAERGVHVDHTTVYRWVRRYAPEIEARRRWIRRAPSPRRNRRVDETHVRVRGRWAYLHRAVDEEGRTLDFHLSFTRSAKAAKRFLGKAIRACKEWETPLSLTTDKAPTYPSPSPSWSGRAGARRRWCTAGPGTSTTGSRPTTGSSSG